MCIFWVFFFRGQWKVFRKHRQGLNTLLNSLHCFTVQLKWFFIDIQSWSSESEAVYLLHCSADSPAGLSCLFIFSFSHLLLDIFPLILTVQYLTDLSFVIHLQYCMCFSFRLLGVLLFYYSVHPVACVALYLYVSRLVFLSFLPHVILMYCLTSGRRQVKRFAI